MQNNIRRIKKTRTLLSLLLGTSAMLGALLLATDGYLWEVPSHAYGLIVFVALDISLIAIMRLKLRYGIIGASSLAAIQIIAMVSAPFTVDDNPLHSTAVSIHIFNNFVFDTLLAFQFVIQISSMFVIMCLRKPIFCIDEDRILKK